jgi:glycerol-3-phosphate dehydrogenase
VRQELAATVEDVLARRLGLQFYSWRDAIKAAPVVGSLMAAELHWSNDATRAAVTSYVQKITRFLEHAGLENKEASAGRASAN